MELKLKIPTCLSEITLKQYKAFLKVQETEKNNKIYNAKVINIFCKVKMEDVMLLKLNDVTEITNIIYKLFDQKPSLVSKFKLNGVEYGFIPQLDDISFGEYIDLDTYIGDWDNIDRAMNVLYRPILVKLKEKYSIDKYVIENHKNLEDMPMNAVLSSIFFLLNLGIELSTIMMSFLDLNKEIDKDLINSLNLDKNGGGISQYTHSLKAILDDLKISQN
jgi:hypothetical protein